MNPKSIVITKLTDNKSEINSLIQMNFMKGLCSNKNANDRKECVLNQRTIK